MKITKQNHELDDEFKHNFIDSSVDVVKNSNDLPDEIVLKEKKYLEHLVQLANGEYVSSLTADAIKFILNKQLNLQSIVEDLQSTIETLQENLDVYLSRDAMKEENIWPKYEDGTDVRFGDMLKSEDDVIVADCFSFYYPSCMYQISNSSCEISINKHFGERLTKFELTDDVIKDHISSMDNVNDQIFVQTLYEKYRDAVLENKNILEGLDNTEID